MSWVKRRGTNTPGATPSVPMYNPDQHSTQDLKQWPNTQPHDNWYNQQQHYQQLQNDTSNTQHHGYWQQSFNSQNYNQQYEQHQHQSQYQPENFQNNMSYNQETSLNNPYNQGYNQNNLYGNEQNIVNHPNDVDAWNQAWGDEDNFNTNVKSQEKHTTQNPTQNTEDAFANDESWNWGLDEVSNNSQTLSQKKMNNPQELFTKIGDNARQNPKQLSSYELKTSSNQFAQRGKLETPQWSTESQISQESSDDILQTSESDKSHKMSHNSTMSQSPLSGQDLAGAVLPDDLPVKAEGIENLSHFENKEIVTNLKQEPLAKMNSGLLPPKSSQTPPILPPPLASGDETKNRYKLTTGISHTAANRFMSSNVTPPTERYQVGFNNQVNLETLPDNSEQPDHVPNQAFSKVKSTSHLDNSEIPINDRNQYLETGELSEPTAEVSNEHPESTTRSDVTDSLPPPGLRRMVPGQQEHSEIWGNGNFSDPYNQKQEEQLQLDTSDTLPPPGLRRMIPGQIEQNESIINNNFGSEPSSSMSRMVLGQTERTLSSQMLINPGSDSLRSQYNPTGPPEGLHRMIPGESSSPESNIRISSRLNENDSDVELQQLTQQAAQPRSATIGADTPPAIGNAHVNPIPSSGNRVDIIGASNNGSQDNGRTRGSSNLIDNERHDKISRKTSHSTSKETVDKSNRRDSIEGEPHENKINNITSSIRNMTMGENLTDSQTSNPVLTDSSLRRLSRQESSDSEREQKKLIKVPRDKRSSEKLKRDKDREKERMRDRDRNKDRYSPDNYRDRKYDRRRYKDRYYDDETDCYSDKEKDRSMREDIDRDYERKYSSLRKEKDKDRHRKEHREYRRDDYYYGRRYQDDYDEERSRPSSRSDSIRDLYRERQDKDRRDRRDRDRGRDREKDRYRQRREPRDVYNPYQGYAYDPYNPYYQQYQYYENLRRTNPQAYAEWYHKYYQQMAGHASSYGGEDRASVHSGRSSANDELVKDRYTRQSFYSQANQAAYYGDSHAHSISGHYGQDISSFGRSLDQSDSGTKPNDSTSIAQRLTPAKFATAHLKASISSGRLLKVLPHYSLDGQNATVEICSVQSLLLNNEEYKELSAFPGPLVKGITHKKTIIEYCENKIRFAIYNKDSVDIDSYILMWELLILLIRQNGMVVGTDIAELLLKNRRDPVPQRSSSVISNVSSSAEIDPTSESSNQPGNLDGIQSNLKEEEVTNRFREFLLYGSGQEALEWAMKHGLWGHALFLASKLDKRTYANVMMRFANGLTLNDPLQTLYQLLSGKMPAAVTCISDEKWGEWRPHLAMILSNSKQRPELHCKAVTAMGDTLSNRGNLYAAQFCYLMAQTGFGKHDDPDTRLVLLGADHSQQFPKFATSEAIHMTEIYEYACGLNSPDFVLPQFQTYKYLLATRLADYGLLEKSLSYLEAVSLAIIANPGLAHPNLITNVASLADKLKFYDPVGEVEDESEFGGILETSRLDHSWLKNLRAIQEDYQAGLISHHSLQNLQNCDIPNTDPSITNNYDTVAQNNWQQFDQQYATHTESQIWQPEHVTQNENQQQENQLGFQQNDFLHVQYQDQQQQNYYSNQQQWTEQQDQFTQENVDEQENLYEQNAKPKEVQKEYSEDLQQLQPQISLPNQSKSIDAYKEASKKETENQISSPAKLKPSSLDQEKTQSTGWFGGIFSKLTLKPKNQMKLPDDNNPKIVYDQEKKRWVNLDEDPNDPANEIKPPPKISDMLPKIAPVIPAQSNQSLGLRNSQPPSLTESTNPGTQPTSLTEDVNSKLVQTNMFKLQRGRNLKNSYVDLFNPSGKTTGPAMPIPDVGISAPNSQMNFFIPQPISDPNAPVDFLTPGGVPHLPEQQLQ